MSQTALQRHCADDEILADLIEIRDLMRRLEVLHREACHPRMGPSLLPDDDLPPDPRKEPGDPNVR